MIYYVIFFFLNNYVFYMNVKWFIGIDIIVIVFNKVKYLKLLFCDLIFLDILRIKYEYYK